MNKTTSAEMNVSTERIVTVSGEVRLFATEIRKNATPKNPTNIKDCVIQLGADVSAKSARATR